MVSRLFKIAQKKLSLHLWQKSNSLSISKDIGVVTYTQNFFVYFQKSKFYERKISGSWKLVNTLITKIPSVQMFKREIFSI